MGTNRLKLLSIVWNTQSESSLLEISKVDVRYHVGSSGTEDAGKILENRAILQLPSLITMT